jgi:hypothetical protein
LYCSAAAGVCANRSPAARSAMPVHEVHADVSLRAGAHRCSNSTPRSTSPGALLAFDSSAQTSRCVRRFVLRCFRPSLHLDLASPRTCAPCWTLR